MFEEFTLVRLLVDLPDEGLSKGTLGTVLMILRAPTLGYEVEFEGAVSGTFAVQADQIEPALTSGSSEPPCVR